MGLCVGRRDAAGIETVEKRPYTGAHMGQMNPPNIWLENQRDWIFWVLTISEAYHLGLLKKSAGLALREGGEQQETESLALKRQHSKQPRQLQYRSHSLKYTGGILEGDVFTHLKAYAGWAGNFRRPLQDQRSCGPLFPFPVPQLSHVDTCGNKC